MFLTVLRKPATVPAILALALGATALAQTPSAPNPTPAPASGTTTAPKIEDQASFTVVGLTVRTNNAREAGGQGLIAELWQAAVQNRTLEQIPNKIGDGYVVVYSNYASDFTGDYDYTLGYRVSSVGQLPEGLVVRTIRAGKYAVFTSETGPPHQVISSLWKRINSLNSQQRGGDRAYQTDFETYADITDWSNVQMTAYIGLR
jgi:predicted transcriptional regulator YdeE